MTGRFTAALAVATALTFAGPALAGGGKQAKAFIEDAIQGNIAEVKMAELGEQKAQSDDVKEFAETLKEDHNKALDDAQDVAQSLNISAPSDAKKDAQQDYQKLSKASGKEFDRAFVEHMVKDHQKDIEKFTEAAKNVDDPEVSKHAQEILPVLKKHLETAQKLQKEVGS